MCNYSKYLLLVVTLFVTACADFNRNYKKDYLLPKRVGVEEHLNNHGQPIHIYCRDCLGPTKKTPVYKLNKVGAVQKTVLEKPVPAKKNLSIKNTLTQERLGVTLTPILSDENVVPISKFAQGQSFGSAFFTIGSSVISEDSKSVLDEIVVFYQNHQNLALRVSGYTDLTGPALLNKQIANDRAHAVINYLTQNGIEERRITNVTGSSFNNGVGERRADALQGGEIIFVGFNKNSNRLSESAIYSINKFVSTRSHSAHYWLRGVIDNQSNISLDEKKLDHKSVDLAWAVRMHLIGLGINRENIRILRRHSGRTGWRVDVESLGDQHPLILSKI